MPRRNRKARPSSDNKGSGPKDGLPPDHPPDARSKYKAKITFVDGQRFASKKEARCYLTLKALVGFGTIRELKTQVSFSLNVNGKHVCRYVADFTYTDTVSGERVVADAKGFRTAIYKLKKKLMKAVHGIDIVEM